MSRPFLELDHRYPQMRCRTLACTVLGYTVCELDAASWNTRRRVGNAFKHLAAVVLGIELLRSLDSIARSTCGVLAEEDIASLNLERLRAYRPDFPQGARDLHAFLEDKLAEFEAWANNARSMQPPLFLPGNDFLRRLIDLVRQQLPQLDSAVFFVYIDEYENLAEYQQRVVNTWLKHSEPPLIFNLAMKRNGFKTRSTDGSESLSAIHDYRLFDLEDFDLEREFPVFAAEILLLRLKLGGVSVSVIDPEQLRDTTQLGARKEQHYARKVQETARSMFPTMSQCDMAIEVFADPILVGRLEERVKRALAKRGASTSHPKALLPSAFPEASIIVPALLHRDAVSVETVKDELAKLAADRDNKFTVLRTGFTIISSGAIFSCSMALGVRARSTVGLRRTATWLAETCGIFWNCAIRHCLVQSDPYVRFQHGHFCRASSGSCPTGLGGLAARSS